MGIKDGVITIVLNPELTPYFVKIAGQYSTYKLDSYMRLHTWYAMRFYEILSSFQDSG
ncbi:MAG TPA: replication initiation protein [Hymenobacter sp.]|nr:replication initiation protein [Hymenobacter sp.]